jgi:hypothetical protein
MSSQQKRTKATGEGPRIGHLDSLTGILKEMQAVYREARVGKTPLPDATKLVFVLKSMREVLEAMALEGIERRLAEMQDKRNPGYGHEGNDRSTALAH